MRKLNILVFSTLAGTMVAVIGKIVTGCDWFSAIFIGMVFGVSVACAELITRAIKKSGGGK